MQKPASLNLRLNSGIVCLAAVLLAGCGSGSNAGTSDRLVLAPRTQPQINGAIQSSSVNPNSLNQSFANSYMPSGALSGVKVSDGQGEFLLYTAGGDGHVRSVSGEGTRYRLIRNSGGGNNRMTYEEYNNAPGGGVTLAVSADFYPSQVNARNSGLGTDIAVGGHTLAVRPDALEIPASGAAGAGQGVALNIRDGYNYTVHETIYRTYSHFVRADYAALHFSPFGPVSENNAPALLSDSFTYGALTHLQNLPAANLSYSIDHAMGNHGDKFLHGTGKLLADFTANSGDGSFVLNLDIDDHEGNDFVNVRDVNLFYAAHVNNRNSRLRNPSDGRLQISRNQLHNFDCKNSSANGLTCGGGIDYADSSLRDINDLSRYDYSKDDVRFNLSFYGPGGEEIAGGFYDGGAGGGSDVNLGFIGRESRLVVSDISNDFNARYNQSSGVLDAGEQFLIYAAGGSGVYNTPGHHSGNGGSTGSDARTYRVFRNNATLTLGIPEYVEYHLDNGDPTPLPLLTASFGQNQYNIVREIRVPPAFTTLTTTRNVINITVYEDNASPQLTFAFDVYPDRLEFNSGAARIDFSGPYSYHVFQDTAYCAAAKHECRRRGGTRIDSGVFAYSHFIRADYAGLYLQHYTDDSVSRAPGDVFINTYTYGAQTQRQNLPTNYLSYRLDHALGGYRSTFLHGSGNLLANFASGDFRLNLNIDDDAGNDFAAIRNMQLFLDADRNQINNFRCAPGQACEGQIAYDDRNYSALRDVNMADLISSDDYNAASLFINASFYGANSEEVAGGFYHGGASANGAVNIGFIGRESVLSRNALAASFAARYNSSPNPAAPPSNVEDANAQFLVYTAGGSGTYDNTPGDNQGLGRDDRSYHVIRNAPNGTPVYQRHELAEGAGTAAAVLTASFGDEYDITRYYDVVTSQINPAGTVLITIPTPFFRSEVTINYAASGGGTDSFLFAVYPGRLEFPSASGGSVTIHLETGGYNYQAFQNLQHCAVHECTARNGVRVTSGVGVYSHFIKAEYAALYLQHYTDDSVSRTAGDALINTHTYGVLTQRENLPTVNVSYRIDHALGGYQDKFLHGSGDLQANFADGDFELNLNIADHEGNNFAEVQDVQLFLDPHRNQIHNFECGRSRSECAGLVLYDDTHYGNLGDVDIAQHTRLQAAGVNSQDLFINASFYGEDGEEVAGGFRHERASEDGSVNIGFIGKQE